MLGPRKGDPVSTHGSSYSFGRTCAPRELYKGSLKAHICPRAHLGDPHNGGGTGLGADLEILH